MNQEKKLWEMNETGEKQRKGKTNEGKKGKQRQMKVNYTAGRKGGMDGGRQKSKILNNTLYKAYLITHFTLTNAPREWTALY